MSMETYRPATEVAPYQQDPTGGRLVAWAQAASAANQLAKALATTDFVPKEMKLVGNATAAILMGDELGLSPLAAMRSIYVVHGTPALYARSMVALALSRGHEVWTEESSDTKVVVCGRRKGSDHIERSEWTMSRAAKAGYTGNKKYGSNPQEMLYSKAAGEIARKVAPDMLAGIPYSVEDLELGEVPTVTVTREAPAKRTVSRAPKPAPDEPEIPESEPIGASDEPESEPVLEPEAEGTPLRTSGQSTLLWTLAGSVWPGDKATTRAALHAWLSKGLGREITTTTTITKAEAAEAIDHLEDMAPADGPVAS